MIRKSHDSELRGQEEAGPVLFTRSTIVNFVNTLNKPSLKVSVRYKDSVRSNYIESVTQHWRKLVPPILSTSH